jgi:hypothetical protein
VLLRCVLETGSRIEYNHAHVFFPVLVGRFKSDKKTTKQIKGIFDADDSGEISIEDFTAFCETENIAESAKAIANKMKANKKKKKTNLELPKEQEGHLE